MNIPIADFYKSNIQIICFSDAWFLLLTGQENSGKIVCYSDHHSNVCMLTLESRCLPGEGGGVLSNKNRPIIQIFRPRLTLKYEICTLWQCVIVVRYYLLCSQQSHLKQKLLLYLKKYKHCLHFLKHKIGEVSTGEGGFAGLYCHHFGGY